ncbi:MAG: hypothetical protein QF567_01310 [Candidatus Pacearchaeota archaeon]|jgi:hypothetical protein|nr:hypothetical protein [Candidatus Pacearchaeota archaeon]MDP7520852.1 hypothetical protein [Candidatus Pacearchaeota archaeon]|tara:strand:+ start:77 stop:397 length:321 start_codon:yes stop_codon:yes gene_type:complete
MSLEVGIKEYYELRGMEEEIRKKVGPNKLWGLQHYSFEVAVYATREVLDLPLKGKEFLELAKIFRGRVIEDFYRTIYSYNKSDNSLRDIQIRFLNKGEIRDLIRRI